MAAVKDYLPIEDAKLTVEKPVKEKPTTAELTTIEKPGKPVRATQLENTKAKKPIRKSKKSFETLEKSQLTKIEKPKADSVLIITEKPQAAQKIAFALGNPRKQYDNKVSYYEFERDNKKIIVASAVGHLFNLTYAPGQKGWPVFKIEWVPSYKNKNAAFTKSYFDLLKKLTKRSKEFILATDYDIEGELIGWNVLRFICAQQTAKRMKFSTLTKNELEKSFENPMPEPDWGQAYAGETRHILDWLYGINLSRALMSAIKTSGSFKVLSIGRVQGPALKIIVEREKEINNFKPMPYWQVFAIILKEEGTSGEPLVPQEFKHPKDIFNKEELEFFKDIKEATAETKKTEEKIQPPYPFDLTTLQREAYRWHNISPSQTLSIAQKLYLDGLISYPRTSSQKIPDSIEPKKILKALEKHFPEQTKLAIRAKPIEGKKSDPAHPCFTKDTKITLNDREITFSKIAKAIKNWEYNKNKNSYYSKINIPNVISCDHKTNKLVYSRAYQIWKTPINKKIVELKDINLKVTDNHPIFAITKNKIGYVKAGDINIGDYIFKLKAVKIKEIL